MSPITSINLKWWLPCVVTIFSLVLYTITSAYQWHSEKEIIYSSAQSQLKFDMTALSREVDRLYKVGMEQDVGDLLVYRGVNTNYQALFLVDATNSTIIEHSTMTPSNKRYVQIAPEDKLMISKITGSPKFSIDRKNNVIHSYFAIQNPLSSYRNDLSYILVGRYNVASIVNQNLNIFIKQSLLTAGLFILFIFSLFWFHRKFVHLPYGRLKQVLDDFSHSHKAFNANIIGTGEFKNIANAFEDMTKKVEEQITETSYAYELAESRLQKLNSVFTAVPDLVFILDDKLVIVDYRAGAQNLLYLPPAEFIDKRMPDVLPANVGKLFTDNVDLCKSTGDLTTFEYELNISKERQFFEARVARVASLKHFVVIVRDITAQKRNKDFIERQAFYDTLTGLPKRYLALDRLKTSLTSAQRNNGEVGIAFIDLDDFKNVNDSLGHHAGDALLIDVAKRLTSLLRHSDTVARIGGDEFIIIFEISHGSHDVESLMTKIINEISQPFIYDGKELLISVSIGIANYPSHGDNPDELLRKADVAMYNAKGNGKNQFSYFSEELSQITLRKIAIEEQLHHALSRNELTVYYQPQFNIITKQLIGAEALLRWNNSTFGMVSPNEFIPIAERNGEIEKIGRFVIKQAMEDIKAIQTALNQSAKVAINLSPRQLRDQTLLNYIDDAMSSAKVIPAQLEFEITEGVLLSNYANVRDVINGLHQRDLAISMDDFGTGYSSLHYLQEYEFDLVKIDKSFVAVMQSSEQSKKVVKAIISLAHSLNLKVLAEGVENQQQLEMLQSYQCDYIQGFYMGKAVPVDEFISQWHDKNVINNLLTPQMTST